MFWGTFSVISDAIVLHVYTCGFGPNFWLGLIVVCPFYDNIESTARVIMFLICPKLSAMHYNGANCTIKYIVIMADSLMSAANREPLFANVYTIIHVHVILWISSDSYSMRIHVHIILWITSDSAMV